jgi:hypothetical protein
MIKSRKIIWAGHVTRMHDTLVSEPQRTRRIEDLGTDKTLK